MWLRSSRCACSSHGSAVMSSTGERSRRPESWWTQWVHRPEQLRLRQFLFQIHFWLGAAIGMWVLLMSLTGAVLVFRNQLAPVLSLDRVVALHASLLAGAAGRDLNAAGASSLILLSLTGAVIWWPG